MKRFLSPWIARTPWLLAAVLLGVLVLRVPAFHRLEYWKELSHSYFPMAALALVLTPIVLTGGIDLSVGSIAVLSGAAIGVLWRDAHWPMWAALAAGLVVGLLAGSANATLVRFGVLPLVATLAVRELARGLARSILGYHPVRDMPESMGEIWRTRALVLPVPVWLFLLLLFAIYGFVHRTWMGRAVYALGDNELAARFAGLPVARIKAGLYVASGLVAGLCGLTSVLEFGAAKPEPDRSWELLAIACVVLGGVRITGGSGHVAGTVLGIVTLTALQAGLLAAAPEWREALVGLLLVGFALLNEATTRRGSS